MLPSILLLLFCASVAETASDQIVGRWRSLENIRWRDGRNV
jgi:hypothetical protein